MSFFADRDIASLPLEKIKLAKGKTTSKVNFLTEEQLKKLYQAPDTATPWGLRDRAILETLFSSGMRIAELASLNREHIKIRPETMDLEIVIIGKGSRPRPIFFSQQAVIWLKKYLENRENYLKQIQKIGEKALFINFKNKKSDNLRLSHRSMQRSIKKYAVLAGVPLTLTPHGMRHSAATFMLSHGADLRTVQEFLGHKSIAATQIYTHITNKRLRDIHRKLHSGQELKNIE